MKTKLLTASFLILLSLFLFINPSFAEECEGECIYETNGGNVNIENNNNNENYNENHQVVRIENSQPQEEVVTVTEGGMPVYEVIEEIYETPPTGPEAFTFLSLLSTGIVGLFLRKSVN